MVSFRDDKIRHSRAERRGSDELDVLVQFNALLLYGS